MSTSVKEESKTTEATAISGFAAKPITAAARKPRASSRRDPLSMAVSRNDFIMEVKIGADPAAGEEDNRLSATAFFTEGFRDGSVNKYTSTVMFGIPGFTQRDAISILGVTISSTERFWVRWGGSFYDENRRTAPLFMITEPTTITNKETGEVTEIPAQTIKVMQFPIYQMAFDIWKAYRADNYAVLDHDAIGIARETPEQKEQRKVAWEAQQAKRKAATQSKVAAAVQVSAATSSGITVS